MKYGLKEKTIEQIQAVFSKYPNVEKAVLYGSRAKGNYKNGSDIDLTLHGKDLTLKIQHKIATELDDLLLPYKIDLSIFDQITNPEFIDHIQRVGIVFYERAVVNSQLSIDNGDVMKKGWEIKKLSEVCQFINGRAYNKQELLNEGKYTVLRVGNFFTSDHWYYSDLELDEDKYCDNGDLLYAWSASFGPKIWDGGKVIYHYHIWKVVPNENLVTKEFLYHFLDWDKDQIKIDQGAGTTMTHVSKGSMDDRLINIPSLPEQQRIVSVLDEAFASIAQANSNAERNLVNARELFESVLETTFDNSDWKEKRLDEICEVKDGTHDTPQYVEDGIPFVTQKNIREDGLSFDNTKFIALSDHEKYYKRSNVFFGDILISMIGANRGMACVVDDKRVFSIKNVGLIKSSKNINQSFLLYFLKSPKAKKYISINSKGGAQEFIGLTELRKFPILFAPLAEQRAIVGRLEALSAETNRLEEIYQSKLDALEELKKSVLQKAFEGSL